MSLKLGTTVIAGIPTGLINTVNQKLDAVTYTDNPRTNSVYLKTTYKSGVAGYNIWSNGYCEQWGQIEKASSNQAITITFLKTFVNTDYVVFKNMKVGTSDSESIRFYSCYDKTVNSFTTYNAPISTGGGGFDWLAKGYLADGEY